MLTMRIERHHCCYVQYVLSAMFPKNLDPISRWWQGSFGTVLKAIPRETILAETIMSSWASWIHALVLVLCSRWWRDWKSNSCCSCSVKGLWKGWRFIAIYLILSNWRNYCGGRFCWSGMNWTGQLCGILFMSFISILIRLLEKKLCFESHGWFFSVIEVWGNGV